MGKALCGVWTQVEKAGRGEHNAGSWQQVSPHPVGVMGPWLGHHPIPEPAPQAYTLTPTQLTSLVALGGWQGPPGLVRWPWFLSTHSVVSGLEEVLPQCGLQPSVVLLLSIWGSPSPLVTIAAAPAWLLRGPETPPSPAWPALPAQQPCRATPFTRPHLLPFRILGSAFLRLSWSVVPSDLVQSLRCLDALVTLNLVGSGLQIRPGFLGRVMMLVTYVY